MNELHKPAGITGDDNAAEKFRVWIAHNELHVSMLLDAWHNTGDSKIDERDGWGFLLADLTRHIANGMMQSHGWDYDSTRDRIKTSFLRNYDQKDHPITGTFSEE